jgi:uncharacterized membrane protein YgdD (TMEM256/DUF423 family)
MDRTFAALGALIAGLAVAAGAFGAHALKGHLSPDEQAIFETGARYQMYHGLALLATAWLHSRWPSGATRAAGWLFVIGVALFSGSLYALALTGTRGFGAITPLGGLAFLVAWGLLAYGTWRAR